MRWRETHGIRETHGSASLQAIPLILAIMMVGCRTQQTVETHCRASYHHQQHQSRYDSARITDLTVIHDTIAVIRTETIWREPDSIGNIYPLMTSVTESAAKRQTRNNVVATRIDTLFITSNTDDVATEAVTVTEDARQCVSTARASPLISWGIIITVIIILIIAIAAVFAIKLLRRFSFP